MLTFFLICLVIGALVGFLAGLFGIGGGLIIVPVLVYLLPMAGIPDNLLMSSALGTSFATIVVTGFSSAQRHHKLGNIVWDAVKILAPVIMVTTFISGLFIGKLDKAIASKIFACLVVYLALKMVLSIKPKQAVKTLTKTASVVGGILIGIASSAAGIGGLSGMLSFIIGGWNADMPDYSLGYVYLPAVVGITATSFFTSKLGATTTTKLPIPTLKRYFALMLIAIAIDMFIK